jgi:hypothetical protein
MRVTEDAMVTTTMAKEARERLQSAMRVRGVDGLLLGGDGAGVFAGGHTRIGVHMPGWPLPMTVVTTEGEPHVVTADPDGATHLPAGRVHGLMWNPMTLVERARILNSVDVGGWHGT